MEIAGIIFLVWLSLSIIDVVMQRALTYATSTEHKLDEQLMPILRRMLKILVVITGAIYILQFDGCRRDGPHCGCFHPEVWHWPRQRRMP
ncbi:MAG: hypothetical protein R2788_07740 [Saprospiraceae bacterium]